MLFTEDDLRNLGDSAYKAFKQWCAENTAMASVEKFLASPEGKVYYEQLWDGLIQSKELPYNDALQNRDLKLSLLQFKNLNFVDESGKNIADQHQEYDLAYRLAQNETYADCIKTDNCNDYIKNLKANIDDLWLELVLNQLIVNKYAGIKDFDLKNITSQRLLELRGGFAKEIRQIKNGSKKIDITPEVAVATYAMHNKLIGQIANERNHGGLQGVYQGFNYTLSEKYPKYYPIVKNMLINVGAGFVAGPAGLAVVATVKSIKAVNNLRKEAQVKGYDNFWQYMKKDKAAAIGFGFMVAGTAMAVCVGYDALAAGNLGLFYHGAEVFKTPLAARYGRIATSLGAGLTAAYGQMKKGETGGALRVAMWTFAAAGAGLLGCEGRISESFSGNGKGWSLNLLGNRGAAQIGSDVGSEVGNENGDYEKDWIGIRTIPRDYNYYDYQPQQNCMGNEFADINANHNVGEVSKELPDDRVVIDSRSYAQDDTATQENSAQNVNNQGINYQGERAEQEEINTGKHRPSWSGAQFRMRHNQEYVGENDEIAEINESLQQKLPNFKPDMNQAQKIEQLRAEGWENLPNCRNAKLRLVAVIDCSR